MKRSAIIDHELIIIDVFAEQTGIEPVPLVFQTNVQTFYTTLPIIIDQ